MKTTWLCIPLMATLTLVTACADDTPSADGAGASGGAGGSTATTGGDSFPADCQAGSVEEDLSGASPNLTPTELVWMGPGVDSATGELMPQEGTLIVSTTYLRLQPTEEARARFGELMNPLLGDLFGNPELVAVQLGMSERCGSARTLSVWRSVEGMFTFVTSDSHANAAAAVGDVSRGGSVVTHWEAASVDGIGWEEAVVQAAAVDGPFY